MKKNAILVVAVLLLLSCSRNNGFLYRPPSVEIDPHVNDVHTSSYEVKNIMTNPIDILWVIDNSGSMGDDIQNVSTNANLFMQQFSKVAGADWKMGLISTDISETPYLGFMQSDVFDSTDPDPVTRFRTALSRLGTNGSATEMTCAPAYRHLTTFPNFMRKGAKFALIVLTDEDEQSSFSGGCGPFLTHLTQQKGSLKDILSYSVLGTRDMCPFSGYFGYAGSAYESLFNNFPLNKMFSLCSTQFGNDLAKISTDIVSHFERRRVVLSDLADPKTIKVMYNGKEIPGGLTGAWVYVPDSNAVEFSDLSFAVGNQASVDVVYKLRKAN